MALELPSPLGQPRAAVTVRLITSSNVVWIAWSIGEAIPDNNYVTKSSDTIFSSVVKFSSEFKHPINAVTMKRGL